MHRLDHRLLQRRNTRLQAQPKRRQTLAGAGFLSYDGADYVYSLMTSYEENPPAGFKLGENMHYNVAFKGHQIAMPPPLSDVGTDPRFTEAERKQFLSSGIAAFLGVPLTKGRQWVAAVVGVPLVAE